jgi:hypothetical protein
MKTGVLVCLATLCACGTTSSLETSESASLHADASIRYTLPADGCSWTVVVGGVEYAPDPDSLTLVRAFAHDAYGEVPASIDYQPTGGTRRVECGWGTSRELPEISVQAIMAPCFSPVRNLDRAYDDGAVGCSCTDEPSVCVPDSTGREVALICSSGRWTAVEDGPCFR